MDPFSDLLGKVRAQGAMFGRATLRPPWSLRVADGADFTLLTPMSGSGLIIAADGTRYPVKAWDSVVVRGPEPFSFVDSVESAELEPRQISCDPPIPSCPTEESGGEMGVLLACYRTEGSLHKRLSRVLPQVVVVTEDDATRRAIEFVAAAAATNRPGWQVVLDRLLDWGLVCVLRTWFDQDEENSPGWYRGMSDPVVGAALLAMHTDPARPWTVAELAEVAGVSRALLAKRFSTVMGEPPLAYLTEWRMELAADLLQEESDTIQAVARRVGYRDGFAFSAAFKRLRGISPSAFRASPEATSTASL